MINNKQIAVMDYKTGNVSFHTLPLFIDSEDTRAVEDYIYLTLEINNNLNYMICDNIVFDDFRNKAK